MQGLFWQPTEVVFAQQWIGGCTVCFEVCEGSQDCLKTQSTDRMAADEQEMNRSSYGWYGDACAALWEYSCGWYLLRHVWTSPSERLVVVLHSNADAILVDSVLRNPWYPAQSCKNLMFCITLFVMWEESWRKIQKGLISAELAEISWSHARLHQRDLMTEEHVQQQYKWF